MSDPDRKRTAKKSAEVFAKIIKSNTIPAEYLGVESSQWHRETVGSSEMNTLGCPDSCEYAELVVMVTAAYRGVILRFVKFLLLFVGGYLAVR
jgi:hypothetical protein